MFFFYPSYSFFLVLIYFSTLFSLLYLLLFISRQYLSLLSSLLETAIFTGKYHVKMVFWNGSVSVKASTTGCGLSFNKCMKASHYSPIKQYDTTMEENEKALSFSSLWIKRQSNQHRHWWQSEAQEINVNFLNSEGISCPSFISKNQGRNSKERTHDG